MAFSNSPLSKKVYPDNFEQKIGFDAIKELIKNYCLFEIGVDYAAKLSFHTDVPQIEKMLLQTMEFKEICLHHTTFCTTHYYDLREQLEQIIPEGTFMQGDTLALLLQSLESINKITRFLITQKAEFPVLYELSRFYVFDEKIIAHGRQIIDQNNQIKDNASPELFEIRTAIKTLNHSLDKKINSIYDKLNKNGYAPDTGITIRSSRYVIPVFAAHKRQVKGLLYDESATGQTVYIEPIEVFTINNEIAEKLNAEKKEIIRILKEFADAIRRQWHDIFSCFRFLGIIDFIRAKALLSISIDAQKPEIKNFPLIEWYDALHPLLYLKNKKLNKTTVPLSITINESQRVLIISGPNAGGKSVCLKTIGLLQYMLQCGIPIPVAENSKAGIFSRIFLDIGDEQSLENDLSTYSSHLKNMNFFIENVNKHTLFLIDEMGAGTEPQIGGALAEAVLESLYEKNALGLITTHYLNLKMLSQKHNEMLNAAMLFDHKNLEPLFILRIGEPGSSFAFEIAQSIGLPKGVVENAKSKIDTNIVDFESFYMKVKEKEAFLKNRLKEIENSDNLLHTTYEKYKNLADDLEAQKKNIILQARLEAQTLISEANKKIEHLIKSIKESNAEKTTTIALRKELEDYKKHIAPKEITFTTPLINESAKKEKKKRLKEKTLPYNIDTTGKPLCKGDYVVLEGQNEVGTVEDIKDDNVMAVFGNMRLKLSKNKLKKVINYNPPKIKSTISQHGMLDIEKKQKHFKPEIDLRGKRAEEALKIVDDYIHTAVLCNVKHVRILHGKGDGILRTLIQQSLRNNDFIEKCYDEHIDFGGHGITIAHIK